MLSKGLTKFVEKFSARVQQSLWSNSQQGFSKSKVCWTIFSKGSTKFLILDRKRNRTLAKLSYIKSSEAVSDQRNILINSPNPDWDTKLLHQTRYWNLLGGWNIQKEVEPAKCIAISRHLVQFDNSRDVNERQKLFDWLTASHLKNMPYWLVGHLEEGGVGVGQVPGVLSLQLPQPVGRLPPELGFLNKTIQNTRTGLNCSKQL